MAICEARRRGVEGARQGGAGVAYLVALHLGGEPADLLVLRLVAAAGAQLLLERVQLALRLLQLGQALQHVVDVHQRRLRQPVAQHSLVDQAGRARGAQLVQNLAGQILNRLLSTVPLVNLRAGSVGCLTSIC